MQPSLLLSWCLPEDRDRLDALELRMTRLEARLAVLEGALDRFNAAAAATTAALAALAAHATIAAFMKLSFL